MDAAAEGSSNFLQDLPYDALYRVMLYAQGIKALASLQRTCKRLYEIGSQEDALWENQLLAYYHALHDSLNARSFAGYYYALRSHVTRRKLEALTRLINEVCRANVLAVGDSSAGGAQVAPAFAGLCASDEDVLCTASEIRLAGGHCLGPLAGQFISSVHRGMLLDTLDLSGMMIRAEGLAHIADAAARGHLPHLATLSLRQNRLGADAKRTGAALRAIMQNCKDLQCLDLGDNGFAGADGAASVCGAFDGRRMPLRLWLNDNHLGTVGATSVLALAAALAKQQRTAMALLSLRSVGVGFAHTTSSGAHDAARSPVPDGVAFVEAVVAYAREWDVAAQATARARLAARQLEAPRRRRGGASAPAATAITGPRGGATATPTLGAADVVRGSLILSDASNNSAAGNVAAAASAARGTLANSLPPAVEAHLRRCLSGAASSTATGLLRKSFGSDNAVLSVSWPGFAGAEPSSCVIC